MATRIVAWDSAVDVGWFALDAGSTLAVRKVGTEIDVREFVDRNRYSGPTKRGFLLTAEQATKLHAALGKAIAAPKPAASKPKANGRKAAAPKAAANGSSTRKARI